MTLRPHQSVYEYLPMFKERKLSVLQRRGNAPKHTDCESRKQDRLNEILFEILSNASEKNSQNSMN